LVRGRSKMCWCLGRGAPEHALHVVRPPRTIRAARIKMHAPMNPAIR
jgi:hypothetical protein